MSEPRAISEPAPAKLNLFLRVVARRPDGYHDIESLVQPLTLADGVQARRSERGLRLTVVGECATGVPRSEDNLALRAARALAEAAGSSADAELLLQKRIPVAAGLGGGSADAAATLRALDRLWGCELGTSGLEEIGASVGSDVPGLVRGLPAIVRGRGDRVQPAQTARRWWVLATQSFEVSAADAYRWWDEDGGGTGPDPGPAVEAAGEPEAGPLASLVFNDLEASVAARHPEIGQAAKRLRDAGALATLMCGSGPTMAGLARDGYHAEEIAEASGGLAVGSITRPAQGPGTTLGG